MISNLLKWLRVGPNQAESGIDRYMIYYGAVDHSIVQNLKKYDLVIVEPQHWTTERVRQLQAAGTRVVGYVSVMEWPTWNVERGKGLRSADYLLRDGQRVYFSEWDSYLMDVREPHYRQLLVDEIEGQIANKGMDGLFLDTVGDIEDHIQHTLLRNEMIHGYLALLADIRSRYPRLWLLQNRGFHFISLAARYLDGFLWEDWQDSKVSEAWVRQQIQALQPLKKAGLLLFAVSCGPGASKEGKAARRHGFVHLSRDSDYSVWSEP
ncbi:endo alpha-1,4 polygalactosaminidase [uncultured Paenibacillus sp.]|uniref:endo alpha-1,4 polygalactosaminidase n=1 Tax=uncultured Paenibacillus sp. TaxID=227322 RepID=UPI0028D1254D|nr:endo alpha-1,4 polygalactosaminidase [uncultured Paenibacillus sp.]